ncbi:coiled-coil domain-containing protein 9-like isoform X2 [Oncorhynchus masou masou]|uniref:coiled-coil domain-containing protein 9-like isoform X2 n=1 Tax=Oncorhynchus masou masou TaxID=90313 RepID=UPI00318436C9
MSTVVDLKTKEEKDAELDRRIEALRKKNEALVRRYQEIEEDKKKAEQEGIAVKTHPPRKSRPHDGPPEGDRWRTEKENFTVTVDLSKPAGEKRVINDWKQGPPRGRRNSEEGEGPRAQGESPLLRAGSGRLSRGGQRGGGPRQERREQRPDRPLADPRQAHDRPPREDRGPPREDRGPPREDRGPVMEGPGEGPGRSERAPRGGRRGRGGRGGREREEGGGPQGGDRKSKEWEEKRRQNIEKMNEEMEKIAEYERGQRPAEGDKPIRNFLDDPRRSGPVPDMDRKEGSRRHVRNWGGVDFDNVKTGSELEKEWTSRRPGAPKGSMDMTMSMTGRERAEYLRWKKEREEIDEERLARHRNATGQWRREWDAQKTDGLFKEDPAVAAEAMLPDQGGRRRDEVKAPPKVPTFGDFLGQGRGPREGGRGERGRGRGQRQSYSMHDNRWEAEKEEDGEKEEDEEKEKEDKPKKEEKTRKEEAKPKAPSSQKMEEKSGDAEEDEDEWEDASDEEDDDMDGVDDSEGDDEGDEEGKDGQSPTKAPRSETTAGKPADTSPPPSTPPSAASPKEQRTPRPKVYIPSQQEAQDSPAGPKPLSPFSPLDGHQPVTDWGEEMEMQSPRSSMGENHLKPPSTEGSPAQVKVQEDNRNSSPSPTPSPSKPAEPEKERDTRTVVFTAAPPEETLIQEITPVSSSSSSLELVSTPTDLPEKEETTTTPPAQETPATPTKDEEETPAATLVPVLVIDQSLSELATAPEMAPDTSEQSSSG